MAKVKPHELRKGEVVIAVDDLPDVSPGTRGKVTMVSGISWTRYRVQFVNGVSVGSLDRKYLARPEEWDARAQPAR